MPSSTSTSPSSPVMVSLPSIHEMFPEHLMRLSPALRLSIASVNASTSSLDATSSKPHSPRNNPLESRDPTKRSSGGFVSFDVWRSDPSLPTLQHIASSATLPNRTSNIPGSSRPLDVANGSAPAFRVKPSASDTSEHVYPPSKDSHPTIRHNYSPSSPSPSDVQYQSSPEDLSDDAGDDKKHICTTCHKRFNRPSSLRIHMNTHTGATPFRCPYPNCGREFNVNSNMRRHYRNHSNPSQGKVADPSSGSHSSAPRRRQRRVDLHHSPSSPPAPANRDFLVLRPDTVSTHAGRSRRGATDPDSPWPPTGNTLPYLSGDSDEDAESAPEDEDEMMEDVRHPSRISYHHQGSSSSHSLYRLQPVSDFSASRYHPQSDIRSLPPPTPTSASTSSCSSPSESPVSTYGTLRR
ncbi:hypothetical protein PM082_008636 [Marasmius tenuissimus]|nr:hypothetical protein PM082_008636 [Marasmius tenuissimus]